MFFNYLFIHFQIFFMHQKRCGHLNKIGPTVEHKKVT